MKRFLVTVGKMACIRDADIDPSGVFKYILIKVNVKEGGNETAKDIVRGYAECPYHCKSFSFLIFQCKRS